jgi:hypothetical protein
MAAGECLDLDPPNFTPRYEITHKRSPLRPPVRLPHDWFGPVFSI